MFVHVYIRHEVRSGDQCQLWWLRESGIGLCRNCDQGTLARKMSDTEEDKEMDQQLREAKDKSKEITDAIQAINLESVGRQCDLKRKTDDRTRQIELIQSALKQQPYSMNNAMKEAQEIMEQVWRERDALKRVTIKQKDLDYCVIVTYPLTALL